MAFLKRGATLSGLVLFAGLAVAEARGSRGRGPAPMPGAAAAPRLRTIPTIVSSPSSPWPLPQSFVDAAAAAALRAGGAGGAGAATGAAPPACTWSPLAAGAFSRGCANGGDSCENYATVAQAEAACAAQQACFAITSQPGGVAPWTLRASGPPLSPSPSGEDSYFISNAAECRPPAPPAQCAVLDPLAFAIDIVGFADDVTAAAARRYGSMIFQAYGGAASASVPKNATLLPRVAVNVTTADDDLRFGVDESYLLVVAGGTATITAPTVFGAVWALETFAQLTRRVWATDAAGRLSQSWFEVCDATVADAPRFPYRGVMLDTSRHFLTPAVLRQAIDLLSSLKLNGLHLHLTDDQSFPLYVPALPQLTNASAYTAIHVYMPDELRALAQYGRLRGVLLFPEVDTPAHSSGIRAAIPNWGCRVPGSGSVLVDPLWLQMTNFSAVRAIWQALDDVFLPGAPFHFGGDEVAGGDWMSCPNATAWAAQNNVTMSGFAVCSWYERSVYGIIRSLGRNAMAWEDACFDPATWNTTDTSAGHLILQQWNQAQYASDVCVTLSTNASVVASGPYSLGEVDTMNRYDPFNFSCTGGAPPTPRMLQQMVGPEYLLWGKCSHEAPSTPRCPLTRIAPSNIVSPHTDDAGDTSSTDLIHDSELVYHLIACAHGARTPFHEIHIFQPPSAVPPFPPHSMKSTVMISIIGLGEAGWSSNATIYSPLDQPRYRDHRCRLAARGIGGTARPFSSTGTYCVDEGTSWWSPPWNAL